MSLVPNHRERQMMQRLRGRGWVKARELPESQGTGRDIAYRLTEEGMAAKKAPVRLY
jgi:predicted transcriptional regulator